MKTYFITKLLSNITSVVLALSTSVFSEEQPGFSKEQVLEFAKDPENHARFERLQKKYMVDLDNWYIGMSVMEISDFISNRYPEKSKKARELIFLGNVPVEKGKINKNRLQKKGIAGIYNDWRRKFEHTNVSRKAILLALAIDLSKTEKIGRKFYNALSMAVKLSMAYCPDLALDLAELDVLLNKSNSTGEKNAIIRLVLIRRRIGLDNKISLPVLRSMDERKEFLKELTSYVHNSKNKEIFDIINNDIERLSNKLEEILKRKPNGKKRKKQKLPWWSSYIIKSQNKSDMNIKEDLKKEILSIGSELYSISKLEKEIILKDFPRLISYANKILGRWNQMTAGLLLRYLDTGESEYVITPQELIFIGVAIERKLKVQAIPIYTFAGQLGVIGKEGDSKARRGHDWFNAMESGIYIGFVITNMNIKKKEREEKKYETVRFGKSMQRLCQYSIVISNDPSKWELFPYMYGHKEMTKSCQINMIDRVLDKKTTDEFLWDNFKEQDLSIDNKIFIRVHLKRLYLKRGEYKKILPIIMEEASGKFNYPYSTIAGIFDMFQVYWISKDKKHLREAMRYARKAKAHLKLFSKNNQKNLLDLINSNGDSDLFWNK